MDPKDFCGPVGGDGPHKKARDWPRRFGPSPAFEEVIASVLKAKTPERPKAKKEAISR